MTTSEGPITLALEKERAPLTTANFLRYVDQKRLDGVTFYRAMKLGAEAGLIQGGPQGDPKRILKPVPHEPTTTTGLSHVDGTISLARFAPGTATADFFITVGPVLSLDANPAAAGDVAGFAAFGHVVEGMDVVKRILAAPTSATAGVGVMKGQMIAAPVKVLTVRRVK
jgi:peptidyl-prolyl cis-trans isomerase A (cyclophilin A)